MGKETLRDREGQDSEQLRLGRVTKIGREESLGIFLYVLILCSTLQDFSPQELRLKFEASLGHSPAGKELGITY